MRRLAHSLAPPFFLLVPPAIYALPAAWWGTPPYVVTLVILTGAWVAIHVHRSE
ncbi:hypothetical protein BPNPMPFG_002464 [Mesorhizobium sp. AR07]|uniref:hypothetical protein n=1 Tax=Mesorhizobium sp. AR07 TaxID=2865838 RepID=UPI00215F8CE5|nr:hypothetical protein [Mesorhizobium sp. AR07]UVK46756.1 hypothetical protein BPNPMPFG_002464 [Mesorhizobium sp. AR07]